MRRGRGRDVPHAGAKTRSALLVLLRLLCVEAPLHALRARLLLAFVSLSLSGGRREEGREDDAQFDALIDSLGCASDQFIWVTRDPFPFSPSPPLPLADQSVPGTWTRRRGRGNSKCYDTREGGRGKGSRKIWRAPASWLEPQPKGRARDGVGLAGTT